MVKTRSKTKQKQAKNGIPQEKKPAKKQMKLKLKIKRKKKQKKETTGTKLKLKLKLKKKKKKKEGKKKRRKEQEEVDDYLDFIENGFNQGWECPIEAIRSKFNLGLKKAKTCRETVIAQWTSVGKLIPGAEDVINTSKPRSRKRKAENMVENAEIKRRKLQDIEHTLKNLDENTTFQLRAAYAFNQEPTFHELNVLSEPLGMMSEALKVWFEKRRTIAKKKLNVSFNVRGACFHSASISDFPRKHRRRRKRTSSAKDAFEFGEDDLLDFERYSIKSKSKTYMTKRQKSLMEHKREPKLPRYRSSKKVLTEEQVLKKAELKRKRLISEQKKLEDLKNEIVARLLESNDSARTRREKRLEEKRAKLRKLNESDPRCTIRYQSKIVKEIQDNGTIVCKAKAFLGMPTNHSLISTPKGLMMCYFPQSYYGSSVSSPV